MEKNFINRWNSDAFETKEKAKKIADDLKKKLKNKFDIKITKNYKTQLKSLEDRKCPYCFLEYSSQVEHYLPKEEFPEFAFMIDNLFPCC